MEKAHLNHINYKIPIIALLILIMVAGLYCFTHIKTSLYPDVRFPKIKIIVNAGQTPVDRMIATVTFPIENLIKKTEGIDYVRSKTSRGSCEISVFLKWSADIDNAKQQIESSVNQFLSSSTGITVTVEKMNPSILPVIGYAIEGNKSLVELKNIAEFQIKPFLSEVDGVANVAVIGGKTKEYQIIVKPEKLSELHVSLAQIQSAITQENIFQSNGYISDHNRLYLTLTNNELQNTEELKNLVIENNPSRLVLLRDVADLQINEAKEYVTVNANGKDLPLIAIMKQPNANVIEVSNGIEKKIVELKSLLPKGVKLTPFYKQAVFEKFSIKSIQLVLWAGLTLSLLVILIFLRSFTASAVVLLSIPFSMTITLIILFAFGYTFNIMTLGAIAAAIGLMIDDVVVVVEQIYKNTEEYPNRKVSFVIGKSMRFLLPAMIGSSLSTIVIFIPYIFMSGAAGAYFKVMAFTMVVALSSSFLVSWLITPMLFSFFAGKKIKTHHAPSAPGKWIAYILRKPVIGFLFAGMCLGGLLFIPGKLTTGFLPEMDEGTLVMDFESPPGTTLEETDRMLHKMDVILKSQPEVESYSRRLGTRMGFTITEANRGDILIQLKKTRKKTSEEVADMLRHKIEPALPAMRIDFGQVIANLLGDLMSSAQPIEIKVFGDDPATIETLSKQIAEQVRQTKGTADAFDGLVITGPKVTISPNVPLLAQLGMNPSDFQFQLQTQIEGNVISTIIDKEQQLKVRIIYPNAQQTKVHSLENTNILLPSGALKPLKSVATIETGKGDAEINRENQKMMGVITGRLNNRDLGSTLNEIREKIKKHVSLPQGYHIEYAGSYSQQQRSFRELLLIFISGLMLVFVVILFLFRNIRSAILILVLTGLGVSGCLLALYITHTPLNVGSYTGIIMIAGIIGENAIFTYLQFYQARKSMSFDDSIIQTISSRLRPKLLTMCTAIVTIYPLALGIGTGAQVHQALAISVMGGLIFALPLLLIVLPTFEKFFGSNEVIFDDPVLLKP